MTKIQKEAPQDEYTMTAWRLKWRIVLRLEAWTNGLRRLTTGNPASQSARFGSDMEFENMGGSENCLDECILSQTEKLVAQAKKTKAKEQRNIAAAFLKVGLHGSGHKTYW